MWIILLITGGLDSTSIFPLEYRVLQCEPANRLDLSSYRIFIDKFTYPVDLVRYAIEAQLIATGTFISVQ